MATNKPYSFDITTATRTGYRFLRSVFKGKPVAFTAQDLNRQFEQIQAAQVRFGNDLGPVLVNVRMTSVPVSGNIGTHTIQSHDGINAMYVYTQGARFTIPATYTFNGAPGTLNEGVFLIAKKQTVTYADDSELSGIDVPIVPYNMESSETVVYVDERIIFGDKTSIVLASGEEIICKIGEVNAEQKMNAQTVVSAIESVPPGGLGYVFLRPTGVSYVDLTNFLYTHNGSIYDYIIYLSDVTIKRLRNVVAYFKGEVVRVDGRIDTTNASITSYAANTAFKNLPNKFKKSNYYEYTTGNSATYSTDVYNPFLAVNSITGLSVNNTLSSSFVTVESGVVTALPTVLSAKALYILKLQDESVLEEGYELTLYFPSGGAFYTSNPFTEIPATTEGQFITYSGSAQQHYSPYDVTNFSVPLHGTVMLKYIGGVWRILDISNNIERMLGMIKSGYLWTSKSSSDMIPALAVNNSRTVADTIFEAQKTLRILMDDFNVGYTDVEYAFPGGGTVISGSLDFDLTADNNKNLLRYTALAIANLTIKGDAAVIILVDGVEIDRVTTISLTNATTGTFIPAHISTPFGVAYGDSSLVTLRITPTFTDCRVYGKFKVVTNT